MALFNNKKKNSTSSSMDNIPAANVTNATQTPNTSSGKVILRKAEDSLEHHIVSLKKSGTDLSNHKARVFVILDRSGSMKTLFNNGSVQETLTRLLPLALKFDDDGELEVYLFNESCVKLPSMNINNFENYVQKEILDKNNGPRGLTYYAPPIEQSIKDFNDGSSYPAFGLYITDGDNFDKSETDAAIRISSKYKIFYQFIGIGTENFEYLKLLDDLSGRDVDNTAFVKVSDFSKLTDDELYSKLLEQYPDWLKAMKLN